MLPIWLAPTLEQCIETTARREYNDTVKLLLTEDENTALNERATLLQLFLSTADFKQLRAESERHLLNGTGVRFQISLENGIVKHRMVLSEPEAV